MLIENDEWNVLTGKILDCAFAVHTELGAGLLESVYEECLSIELGLRNLRFVRQRPLPIRYAGRTIPDAFRLDLMVEDLVILEIKSVERIHPVHEAQIVSYLKMAQKPLGLLLNFHTPLLRDGIKRFLNTDLVSLPEATPEGLALP